MSRNPRKLQNARHAIACLAHNTAFLGMDARHVPTATSFDAGNDSQVCQDTDPCAARCTTRWLRFRSPTASLSHLRIWRELHLACGTRALLVLIEPDMKFTLELAPEGMKISYKRARQSPAASGRRLAVVRRVKYRHGAAGWSRSSDCVARGRFRRSGLQRCRTPPQSRQMKCTQQHK